VFYLDIYSYENEKVYFDSARVFDSVPCRENAIKYLKDSEKYTVDFVLVSNSYSRVFLKEFPHVKFNTVYFKNVHQKGRRDAVFSEEFKQNSDFQTFISRIIHHNSRIRFGLGRNALKKEEVFFYFNNIPYDKNKLVSVRRNTDEFNSIIKKFFHSDMQRLISIYSYHDLVFFHFWNGPNQLIEFYHM